jgi:hypothetical protein
MQQNVTAKRLAIMVIIFFYCVQVIKQSRNRFAVGPCAKPEL